MSNTFFDASEVFPHPTKVRLPKGKPAKVRLTVLDLVSADDAPGFANFEVILLDRSGYMEGSTVSFSGRGTEREYDVPYLSVDTVAVYVMPLSSSAPGQAFKVSAST